MSTLKIGDAAHATTPHLGQGAVQAIKDAVVLGQLAVITTDIHTLLDSFMLRRYERCKFINEGSFQIGEWEQHPDVNSDFLGVTQKMLEVVAEPI